MDPRECNDFDDSWWQPFDEYAASADDYSDLTDIPEPLKETNDAIPGETL